MFRSVSFRLTALYTIWFAAVVILLGSTVSLSTRDILARVFDVRIAGETAGLVMEYRIDEAEGLKDVIAAVREREQMPGGLEYGMDDAQGRPIAGRLAGLAPSPGWSFTVLKEEAARDARIRVLTTLLPNGYRLMIGQRLDQIESLDSVVLRGFALTLSAVLLIGVGTGWVFSRDLSRRFGAISGVAQQIIDGKMSSRVPTGGTDDELDRLAGTLNQMLDRIDQLMDSLRQVSSDVAHDLRTPLARLRQRLEAMAERETDPDRTADLGGALGDLDAVLQTFSAVLRIAETEKGARRAAFRRLDFTWLVADVVEGLDASAEQAGKSLELHAERSIEIEGDEELLAQLIVNLVENAINHTPDGSRIAVTVRDENEHALLIVADNGPGVPAAERERLFERFYRLERSRSTPGSGLGLALVAAIAKLHGARVELGDAEPGLEVRIGFPKAAPLAPNPRLGG